ncbi:hypothetical protein BGZ49_007224 [Haplosporangium sp. Z 27]|nr:hypothetical protein BGZ49_007224 [Haplosporangium sp. Z 27]
MNQFSSTHPLQLSEIRRHVGKLLSLKDLKNCILVCKEWSFDFTRLLWETVRLTTKKTYLIPSQVWLKYHIHVRTLIITSPFILTRRDDNDESKSGWILHPTDCPNLVDLRVVPGNIYQSYLDWTTTILDQDVDLIEDEQPKDELALEQDLELDLEQGLGVYIRPMMSADEMKERAVLKATDRITEILEKKNHPNIRSFVWAVHPQIYTGRLWRQLLHASSATILITSLILASTKVDIEQMNRLLRQCPQLTSLELQRVNLFCGNPSIATLDLNQIDSFTLEGYDGGLRIPIMIHGPRLRHLAMLLLTGNSLKISSSHCPQLQSLHLEGFRECDIDFIRQILGHGANTLEILKLEYCWFKEDTTFISDLVANHSTTLKKLSLRKSTGIESRDIQTLLTSCHNLEDFNGAQQVLEAKDIRSSSVPSDQLTTWLASPSLMLPESFSWSCLNLTELSIAIRTPLHLDPSEHQRLFSLIYSALSPLIHLKTIDLSGGWSTVDRKQYFVGVPWNLKAGLNSLQLLSNMRRLVLTGWEDQIYKEDILWMKQYWPRLHLISSWNEGAEPWRHFCLELHQYWPECMNIVWEKTA